MRRILSSLGLAAILTGAALPIANGFAAAQPRASMSVRVLTPKSAVMTATNPVSMRVRVTGLKLGFPTVGTRPVAGQGHILIYLDSIPSDAYRKANWKNLVVELAQTTFAFQVSTSWLKDHKGHHHLILALAKNNNVLYRAPTVKIPVTVKYSASSPSP